MSRAVACSAPKDGHKKFSKAAAECPVHGVGKPQKRASALPPVPERTIRRLQLESPLPGVMGAPVDKGVSGGSALDIDNFSVARTMECSVGETLTLVARVIAIVVGERTNPDPTAFAYKIRVSGSEAETWRVGLGSDWYLCTDAGDPEGTAVLESSSEFFLDDVEYDNLDEAQTVAHDEVGDDTRWTPTPPQSKTRSSPLLPWGQTETRERFMQEVAFERALKTTDIRRHNTGAIAYMREMGVDLRAGEVPDDNNLTHIALTMSPNLES